MTKKQMEERITQLEKTVMELQSQLLTLSLRGGYTFIPAPIPSSPNTLPTPAPMPWHPNLPYIGDSFPYDGTRITCTAQTNTKLEALARN